MSDREPITSARALETPDFQGIVERFTAPAMALAMNILANRQDAEDACQETFVQVFRNLDRYDGRSAFQNWLYTILYRRCLDVIRKRKRSYRLFEQARREQERRTDGPPHDRSAGSIGEDILKRLSPKERTVLSLWANEGYTAEEISRVIQTTASTARVYLFHARKKLKAVLESQHEALQNS